jgi:indole-3-glycerol phosphate synthase
MSLLDEIYAHKRAELEGVMRARPLAAVRRQAESKPAPFDFVAALRRPPGRGPALIAEIKRASPSRGSIAMGLDPIRMARTYAVNGASAISILTDERYFHGSLADLIAVAGLNPRLPILRKDFIFAPYQLYEARASGADAVLLIVAGLEPSRLRDLHALALDLGMAVLVEVHTRAELDAAVELCMPPLLGINNRDLRDFSVHLQTALELAPLAPEGACRVAESGIHTREDVERMAAAGFDAVLVGEALVSAQDPAAQVRSLAG